MSDPQQGSVQPDQVNIKINFCGQKKVATFAPAEVNFESLSAWIEKSFHVKVSDASVPVRIAYRDPEGDVVTVGSTAELLEALRLKPENELLKLRLSFPRPRGRWCRHHDSAAEESAGEHGHPHSHAHAHPQNREEWLQHRAERIEAWKAAKVNLRAQADVTPASPETVAPSAPAEAPAQPSAPVAEAPRPHHGCRRHWRHAEPAEASAAAQQPGPGPAAHAPCGGHHHHHRRHHWANAEQAPHCHPFGHREGPHPCDDSHHAPHHAPETPEQRWARKQARRQAWFEAHGHEHGVEAPCASWEEHQARKFALRQARFAAQQSAASQQPAAPHQAPAESWEERFARKQARRQAWFEAHHHHHGQEHGVEAPCASWEEHQACKQARRQARFAAQTPQAAPQQQAPATESWEERCARKQARRAAWFAARQEEGHEHCHGPCAKAQESWEERCARKQARRAAWLAAKQEQMAAAPSAMPAPVAAPCAAPLSDEEHRSRHQHRVHVHIQAPAMPQGFAPHRGWAGVQPPMFYAPPPYYAPYYGSYMAPYMPPQAAYMPPHFGPHAPWMHRGAQDFCGFAPNVMPPAYYSGAPQPYAERPHCHARAWRH